MRQAKNGEMNYDQYTDEQLVDGIVAGDAAVVEYFFFKKCKPIFVYIVHKVYDGRVNEQELINELFLYLAENDWYKVRQFDFRSKFTTWTQVVATRFFLKKRAQLIENDSDETLNKRRERGFSAHRAMDRRIDIRKALAVMPNERYRMVITALDLRDVSPEQLAERMEITVDNLYNIHRRALAQLRLVMGRKEDYYD